MECTVLVNVSHVNENHLKFKPNKTKENNVKHGVHILEILIMYLHYSVAFDRLFTKSRMLDSFCDLSLMSTGISDTFVTAVDNSSQLR